MWYAVLSDSSHFAGGISGLTCSDCIKIYLHTHIKPRLNPTKNGQHSMLHLPRYFNIGSTWPESSAVKSISSSNSKSCRRCGMMKVANGSFRSVFRVIDEEMDQIADTESVKVQDAESGSVYSDECDVLISATGALNSWKWPNIPGLHDFKGKLMHSASWDESYDYSVSSPRRPGWG